MEHPHQVPESDEIDLVELLQKLWQGRKIAVKISMISALMGIFVALSSTNIFEPTSKTI